MNVGGKPTFQTNLFPPFFSQPSPETHVEKIPLKKLENLEESPDFPTEPPPSFVERKIGKVLGKLLVLSQFAESIREKFNQPDQSKDSKDENEEEESTISFDEYFENRRPDFSEENGTISREYLPKKEEDDGEIARILEMVKNQNKPDQNETGLEKQVNTSYNVIKPEKPVVKPDKIPERVTEQNKLEPKNNYEIITDENPQNSGSKPNEIKNAPEAEETEQNLQNPGHEIKVNFGPKPEQKPEQKNNNTNPDPESNEIDYVTTSKIDFGLKIDLLDLENGTQTPKPGYAEIPAQIGYFVLELFASFIGLTLGAVSQINHALHQSNNTILEGLYNFTH